MGAATLLHLLGIIVWVGGMFFAYMALRPAAAELLAPAQRLPLWNGTFARFFPWVWFSVGAILVSGLYMIALLGGFGGVLPHVHIMFAVGLVMMAIFGYVYFALYRALARAVRAEDWKAGGDALARIRRLIGLNLSLGLINVVIGLAGRIFG
jgi:uncharacterized membrane protein